jgi:hypothetical protein
LIEGTSQLGESSQSKNFQLQMVRFERIEAMIEESQKHQILHLQSVSVRENKMRLVGCMNYH